MNEYWFACGMLVVLVVACASPYLIYQSVKLGTFAAYRGKQLFDEWTEEKRNNGRNKG